MYQQTQPTQGQSNELGQQREMGMQPQQGQMGMQPQQRQQGSQPQKGMQSQQMGQQGQGLALSLVETPERRQAVEDIERSIQVCGFCADRCIQEADPMMIECIRLCEDVQELGETAVVTISRDSRFSQSILQTFLQAAQACAQECGQHSHAHCQECAQVLGQAVQSIQNYLGTGGQQLQAQ